MSNDNNNVKSASTKSATSSESNKCTVLGHIDLPQAEVKIKYTITKILVVKDANFVIKGELEESYTRLFPTRERLEGDLEIKLRNASQERATSSMKEACPQAEWARLDRFEVTCEAEGEEDFTVERKVKAKAAPKKKVSYAFKQYRGTGSISRASKRKGRGKAAAAAKAAVQSGNKKGTGDNKKSTKSA